MKSSKEPTPLINENIKSEKVHLIDHEGTNRGIVSRSQALAVARDANLDLVFMSEGKEFPIVKVMDYGKMLYAKKKQQVQAKKHQKLIQIKEIKMRPNIGEHDYQTKINKGIEFLEEGKKLKITIMFRGREMANKQERGQIIFDKIVQSFKNADIEQYIATEKDSKSGNMWSRIYYLKK